MATTNNSFNSAIIPNISALESGEWWGNNNVTYSFVTDDEAVKLYSLKEPDFKVSKINSSIINNVKDIIDHVYNPLIQLQISLTPERVEDAYYSWDFDKLSPYKKLMQAGHIRFIQSDFIRTNQGLKDNNTAAANYPGNEQNNPESLGGDVYFGTKVEKEEDKFYNPPGAILRTVFKQPKYHKTRLKEG
jgi:hypothetical protein